MSILSFNDSRAKDRLICGGKGASLAVMRQVGLPVPDGFVITDSSFDKSEVLSRLDTNKTYAVRSSAIAEDGFTASFAGMYESILDVKKEEALAAIAKVFSSAQSERVAEYAKRQGIEEIGKIAVVVQEFIQPDFAGVLFTADPMTGGFDKMVGNYVAGVGETLVSGEGDAKQFTMSRPKYSFSGSNEIKPYAKTLYKFAEKIGLGFDIEWAASKGMVYILQSRPITTINPINYDTYEVNDSLCGDFLWTNANIGEAFPHVMSPITWSIIRALDMECQKFSGYYLMSGNIYGRMYSNINMVLTITNAAGISVKSGKKLLAEVFGDIPDSIVVPVYPQRRLTTFVDVAKHARGNLKRIQDAAKLKDDYIKNTSKWCDDTEAQIERLVDAAAAIELWENKIRPYISTMFALWLGGASSTDLIFFRNKLSKMIGEEQANTLFSNLSGGETLKSIEPLLNLDRVVKGEITKEDYKKQYGHRCIHEFELSLAYPSEDEEYIDMLISEHKKAGVDTAALLEGQRAKFLLAKEAFLKKYPGKEAWLEKKLNNVQSAAGAREALRSEFIKVFRATRKFLLKVGELSGLKEDIFFLYETEIPKLLSGERDFVKHLPKRRASYQKYLSYPSFPQLIRGIFNVDEWLKKQNRSMEYYHRGEDDYKPEGGEMIKGSAGAQGQVEGIVRLMTDMKDAPKFQKGEILLANTTNIGWTPLFSKAAAVITDIGAPLSHAAIVARELGIPAVVGCGNATARLKTGDRVRVDGGRGFVEILKRG